MLRAASLSLILIAGGCVFRVNPDYAEPAHDLGSPDPPAGSAQFPDPGTIATPPPPDLLPSCVQVTEPFTADPSASWTMMGNAAFDTTGGLQLTALGFDRAGSAFFDGALPASDFDATFTFRIGDGSGGDGLAFVVAQAENAGALRPFGDGTLDQGYGLGYLGMSGLAVEFDTFLDLGNGDPNGNHVALVRTSDGKHLLTGAPPAMLHAATSHGAHIRFAGGHLTVEVDGARVIDDELPAEAALPAAPAYFGFTAASGSFNDRHDVADLTLIVGPAITCF